jgi:hypothetical protein
MRRFPLAHNTPKTVAQKKKDAKKRVRSLKNPLGGSNLKNPIARKAFLIFEGAQLGAEILIDVDPYNLFEPNVANAPTPRSPLTPYTSPDDALASYRARQSVPVTPENLQVLFDAQPNPEQAYNDARDLAEINQDQELENALAKLSKTRPTIFKKKSAAAKRTGYGSGRFQSQFGQNMGFDFSQISKPKRKRSTTMKASDKKLSAAFKKANLMCRKKNGQFKKGKSQKDVAKCAHRLRKKM